jgi:drug/metabolite transporter (DMT)-like permease
MELLWIPISMFAALMQAVRTAAQKSMNERFSVMVTTYSRSVFGLPVMLVYLLLVETTSGEATPHVHIVFLAYCLGAAVAQVAATAFLIQLFQLRNFAVGTTLSKTDVMMTAVIGSVLFSERITPLGWVAIVVTLVGVLLITIARIGWGPFRRVGDEGLGHALVAKPTIVGLITALCFTFSYLFLREASLSLGDHGFLVRAAWTVVAVTTMQVILLGLWLLWREARGLIDMLRGWRLAVFIGLTSALGSISWFTAMTLQNASYVRAVGQVEIIFTLAISYLYFKERFNAAELIGIAVIVLGVLLFLL